MTIIAMSKFTQLLKPSMDVCSGVARPGPTRACALPSTSQALPSPTQLESRDSTTNQTKVIKYSCANRYRYVIVNATI